MPLNPVPIGFEALVTPEGELVYSPKANVENNVKNLGYRLPTSEDFSKATLKKEYGEGFGNELTAGVEGALSGAPTSHKVFSCRFNSHFCVLIIG